MWVFGKLVKLACDIKTPDIFDTIKSYWNVQARDVSARRVKRAIARAQRAQVLRVLKNIRNICARLARLPKFARAQTMAILEV